MNTDSGTQTGITITTLYIGKTLIIKDKRISRQRTADHDCRKRRHLFTGIHRPQTLPSTTRN